MTSPTSVITALAPLIRIFVEWLKAAEEDDEKAAKIAWISAKNLLKKEALKQARGG